MISLDNKTCEACDELVPPLSNERLAELKSALDPAWCICSESHSLSQKFAFKGFAKAVYTANLVAYMSDKEGHHADVAFGWGYCHVTFTSHELDRLTENDFICAAKLDALVI